MIKTEPPSQAALPSTGIKPLSKQDSLRKAASAEETDLHDAKTKLGKFLSEASLSVNDLNHIREKKKQQEGSTYALWLDEELAMRELADMIYLKNDVSLVRACEKAGIDFTQDSPSKLNVSLAASSQKERIDSLIAWLSQGKVLTRYEDYVMQLIINEGTAGSAAAAEKLKTIQKDSGKYKEIFIGGLFKVIRGVVDSEQAPLVESFLKYSDPGLFIMLR